MLIKVLKKYPVEITSICSIIFMRFIFYANSIFARCTADSYTYLAYSFKSFINLKGANGRTPVYPLFTRILSYVLGDHLLIGITVIQIILSLVSLFFLYKIILIITNNKNIALVITFLYGSCPAIINWDLLILTESLSLSSTIIFCYLIISYIQSPNLKHGLLSILWSLLITFLRPSFLPFNYALLGFWIARFLFIKNEKKILIKLILTSLITIAFILAYSYIMIYLNFGVFSITPLSPRHLLAACLGSEIYKSYPDTDLVLKIQDIFELNKKGIDYYTTTPVIQLLGGDSNTLKFAKACIKNDFLGYLNWIYQEVENGINMKFAIYSETINSGKFLSFMKECQLLLFNNWKIGHLYILGIGELFVTVYKSIKEKIFSWLHFGLSIFLLGNVLFIYIGTYAEFGRCMIHILPIAFISLGIFLNWSSQKLINGIRTNTCNI